MDDIKTASGEPPIVLEINANHRYKAGHMGVLEFRIRNLSSGLLPSVKMLVDCPCERAREKSVVLRSLAPSSEKKPSFQFEPARGGEALLAIEITVETGDQIPAVYRGQASVDISSADEARASATSFNIDIHEIGKFMGNDLSGMLSIAGKELNEDRLRERMTQKEPFWMRVDLDLDEQETLIRQDAARKILCIPAGQIPPKTFRALLESMDPALPLRIQVVSSSMVRFGRHAQKNDVVLRFLPDFQNDERSKTISGEQFVTRCSEGECFLSAAQNSHAFTLVGGRPVKPDEQIPIAGGTEIRIGTQELGLRVYAAARREDAQWKRASSKFRSFDPGEDAFRATRWDYLRFVRFTNGPEEQYLWLLRKIDLGWGDEESAEFILGQPARPRARLLFANNRYFLESMDPETEIKAADSVLRTGDILCLGSGMEIQLGKLRFLWKLL